MAEWAISAEGITKSFGAFQALDGARLEVGKGSVHALLGENGAGKSTLMNILTGFLRPDSGKVEIHGKPLALGDPRRIRAQGLAMVHQHFMLVPEFTVAENLALDRQGPLLRRLSLKEAVEPALKAAEKVGWDFDTAVRTGSLPVGAQQRLEILKALATGAQVLILDEPTAVLTPEEADDLIRVIRALAREGVSVILIAHKLSEVFAAADHITVLRHGRVTGSAPAADTTPEEAARWMIGDSLAARKEGRPSTGKALLSCEDLHVSGDRGEPAVRGISLEARSGEILGVGGVDGNGQIELAEALAGVRPPATGRIAAQGRIGYIPQDRQRDGLVGSMPIWENTLLGAGEDQRLSWGPLLLRGAARRRALAVCDRFDVRRRSIDQPARSLSGGNQQKVVVGRVLEREPDIVIAVNPTRGLDLNAARFVQNELREAASRGAAVILFSTDREEIEAAGDRSFFMSRGMAEPA
jgi:simple sugar transport system ATP-binding protein